MNTIKYLNWDSSFFNKHIAEIVLAEDDIISAEDVAANNYDLVIIKQPMDKEILIPGYIETFKETKFIFSKELILQNSPANIKIADSDDWDCSDSDFFDLAYESGKHSRFLLDEKFGTEKFKKLYQLWVTNSLNKSFAIKTFFYSEDKKTIKPTGFVTIQQDENIAKIGLIATDPLFQGKGLGRSLLHKAEDYCLENNISKMEIPTQKENTGACIFYHKMGYTIQEQIVIKHFWKISNEK